MAARLPLVVGGSGLPQQLQSGDTLAGAFSLGYSNASPNTNPTYNSIVPTAADTNVSLSVQIKGTGAFTLGPIPASSTATGQPRGQNAVDLQLGRTNQLHVASGQNSFAAGYDNTASGTYAAALCGSNTASGNYSFAAGYNNTASGSFSFAIGSTNIAAGNQSFAVGTNNSVNYDYGFAVGGYVSTYVYGELAQGSAGQLGSGSGNNQNSRIQIAASASAASTNYYVTSTVANASTSSNQIFCPQNGLVTFSGYIQAKQSSSASNVCAWSVQGVIVRGSSGSASFIGTPTVNALTTVPSGWTLTLSIDTSANALNVLFNMGSTAMNIRCNGMLEWVLLVS